MKNCNIRDFQSREQNVASKSTIGLGQTWMEAPLRGQNLLPRSWFYVTTICFLLVTTTNLTAVPFPFLYIWGWGGGIRKSR